MYRRNRHNPDIVLSCSSLLGGLVFFALFGYTRCMPNDKRFFLRILLVALLVSLWSPATAPAEEAEDAPQYRALLIACDEFVEAPEMTPIGKNNLDLMEAVLSQDTRGFIIKRQYGITSSAEALAYAIRWAFADAKEGDVSLLYLSTHGEFDTSHNNPEGQLLLSDGALEDRITAQELNEIFDEIPGTKVLLVDACNSGALIGKGVSPEVGSMRVARTFQSEEYKVLTSSGASEPSWYLLPTMEHAPPGSSYFTTALVAGAGLIGSYAADFNRDGTITLKEMYEYLWINQASSAVQMFPQDDEFPLFEYDKARLDDDVRGELTGISFGNTVLSPTNPVIEFSYTATVNTRVAYRITYLRNGEWDWAHGETIRDETEFDGDMDPLGDVSPGRKHIKLDLTEILPEDWSYGTIHIMTLGNQEDGKQPFIYASRVFSTRPTSGDDPLLSIRTALRWDQKTRRELEIFVAHAIPCNLTVTILSEEGSVVRRLSAGRTTRPQALVPEGSLLYWSGLDNEGNAAPAGTYTIHAKAKIGGKDFSAEATFLIE